VVIFVKVRVELAYITADKQEKNARDERNDREV
jgi:hypothetical protein